MRVNSGSRSGMWDTRYEKEEYERKMYGNPLTAEIAGNWLNILSIKTVEDWGCGYGGFKNYLGSHQTYIGIDGSRSRFADKIEDLTIYQSKVDGIHMRHVLEHNPEWRDILINFLNSFTQRAVLTLFTPLAAQETVIGRDPNFLGTGRENVFISLPEHELLTYFNSSGARVIPKLNITTQYNIEHMFLLSRD